MDIVYDDSSKYAVNDIQLPHIILCRKRMDNLSSFQGYAIDPRVTVSRMIALIQTLLY
jgi:hypothetical protein